MIICRKNATSSAGSLRKQAKRDTGRALLGSEEILSNTFSCRKMPDEYLTLCNKIEIEHLQRSVVGLGKNHTLLFGFRSGKPRHLMQVGSFGVIHLLRSREVDPGVFVFLPRDQVFLIQFQFVINRSGAFIPTLFF